MKLGNLTTIIVSVNYADYLKYTLPVNKKILGDIIVVTDYKDEATVALCEKHKVYYIRTNSFYDNGGFNKYAGINEALKYAGQNDWILFLDADIALHPLTKRVLTELDFDKTKLYGIDRLNCSGLEQWMLLDFDRIVIDNWLMTPGSLELGARINHYYGQWGDNGKYGGWKPLGFFQLAHRSQFKRYPENSKNADHCDIVFANQYDRYKRELIPEIIAVHLESPGSKWGDNWGGRTSLNFEQTGNKCYLRLKVLWNKFKRWISDLFSCRPNYNHK